MNVAFIPVRGGSKSIPLKNIKEICGKPLVFWTIKAANECKYIDRIFVSTDSEIIKNTVNRFTFNKVEVIARSAETASDTASTESAMLEFANKYNFENVVLIQATSPLLKSTDLDNGFQEFNKKGTDSVISVVKQKRFNWVINEEGNAIPTNYDVFKRPRRQEFDGYLVENGAFYITSKKSLLETKSRVSGNIKAIEMNEDSFFEIDEPSDWIIIEELMKKNKINHLEIPEIKMFLTDCDGCLTDGGMYYSEKGDELKKFNTRDGMGFSLLRKKGIITGVITGENVDLNRRRFEKLKIDEYIYGCKNKLEAITNLCKKYNVRIENVCYVGDDINDLEAINATGLGCCPSDANSSVREISKYISNKNGGNGCIREIIDLICNKRN